MERVTMEELVNYSKQYVWLDIKNVVLYLSIRGNRYD